jgi:hypothetical protein
MPEHRATNGTMTCALIELARLQAHQAWIEAKRRVQIFPRDVSHRRTWRHIHTSILTEAFD